MNGNTQDNWNGLNPYLTQMQNLLNLLPPTISNLSSVNTDYTTVNASYGVAVTNTWTLYNQAVGQNAPRPDPRIAGTYLPLYVLVKVKHFRLIE
jgi:hypothetical protein